MRSDDVWEDSHLGFPVGDRRVLRLARGRGSRTARRRGARRRSSRWCRSTRRLRTARRPTCRGAVDDGEPTAAEVEEEHRVVVGLGHDRPPVELPLGDEDAGEGGDAASRAEDARQLMQRVDGDVVHRPAARLAEVPRRVDRDAARGATSAPARRPRDSGRTSRRRSPTRGGRSCRPRSAVGPAGAAGGAPRRATAPARGPARAASSMRASASATVVQSVLLT